MLQTRLLLFFLIIFSLISKGQTVLDWNDCLNLIDKNNLQLKMNVINMQLAEIEVKRNKFNYSPNINAQSNYSLRIGKNYNYFENKYENQIVHYNDFNLNVQQPIFDGFLTQNQIQKSKLDYEALKLDNDALKRNLQMQTMTAYLNILNAKEQLEQAKTQQLSTIDQQVKTNSMIDAGALPESNRYDIDAQMATEEANIIMARNQLNLALLNLKVLLQIDLNEVVDIKSPESLINNVISTDSIPNAADVFSLAVTQRPEVLAQKFRIESAKKNIKIAKSSNYPTLNFLGNINTFYTNQNKTAQQTITGNFIPIGFVESTNQIVLSPETSVKQTKTPYFNQLGNLLNYSFGLGLTIPIYNKNTARFSVKQAEQNIKLSELNQQQTIFDLNNTIQQAYIKTITAKENYFAAKKVYESTLKSYETAAERVSAGLSTQLELNLAKNTLNNSLSRLTQTKYEYIFNRKVLDYYQGKTIQID